MNSAMTVVWLGGLVLLLSPTAAAGATMSRRYSNTMQRRSRSLQQDVCVATASDDFTTQVLGPSAADESLYNNAAFPTFEVLFEDESQGPLAIPIASLAAALLDEQLIYTTDVTFVQEDHVFGRDGEHTQEMLSQHCL